MNVIPPDFLPETASHESERQLRLALRAGKMGLWHIDLATSRAVWDEQVHRLHGWAPGTFPGTWEAFCARIHPEDLPQVRAASRTCHEKRQNFTVQFRVVWPDGSLHWIEDHGILDLDASGKPTGIAGLSVDITARRQTQAQLQTAKEDAERANEAMRRGSEAMAAAGSDTAVMGTLLAQATAAVGAAGAAIKRRVATGESPVTLVAISQDDRVLDTADLAGLPCVAELARSSREDPSGYYAGLFAGQLQSRRCDAAWAAHEPHTAAYHAAHGHRLVWDYPFREEGEVAGWISLAFGEEKTLDAAALQILSVLASHVALALKMIRLSNLAREAAINEERNHLAGEIHDSLAQSFAGIAMQLESAEDAAIHGEHPVVLNGLRRAREVARFGLAEARRSVLALRPADALAHGLPAALQSLAERSRVDNLLECRLEVVGRYGALDAGAETQLFRIAQEAVGNAVRHGHARLVVLTLDCAAASLCLRVRDDGRGFDDVAGAQRSAIGGLRSIQRRVERLQGGFAIDSVPGGGTTLRVTVPRRPTDPVPLPENLLP